MIDSHEIQRLLDGKLCAEEQAMLFQWADEQPDNWRKIAIASLEQSKLSTCLAPAPDDKPTPFVSIANSRPLYRTLLAIAGTLALCCAGLTGAYLGRSELFSAPTQLTVAKDVENPYVVLLPQTQSERTSLGNLAIDQAFRSVSTPLFDSDANQSLRRHGFRALESPTIYWALDEQGNQYVIPKREAILVSDNPHSL